MLHVPYKGEAAAIQAVLAGEIDLAMLVSAKPYVDQKQVTLIGATSPEETSRLSGMANAVFAGCARFQSGARIPNYSRTGRYAAADREEAWRCSRGKVLAIPEMKTRILELGVDPARERIRMR